MDEYAQCLNADLEKVDQAWELGSIDGSTTEVDTSEEGSEEGEEGQ